MTAQEQAEKLAPCPFCGNRNVAQGASGDYISVWCDCGARGPDVPFPEFGDPLPPIRACYAAWNRRTPTPPDDVRLAEIRERAEKATAGLLQLHKDAVNAIVAWKSGEGTQDDAAKIEAAFRAVLIREYQPKEKRELRLIKDCEELTEQLEEAKATAYQAGFDDAREKAGKVAEDRAPKLAGPEYGMADEDERRNMRIDNRICLDIASAVRAIKPGDANGRKG